MVRFVDKPYVSGSVSSRLSTIKWRMACGIGMTRLHFITLADNKKDLFDIYPAAVFKQKSMRRSNRVIIGIAGSYKSATELIETMILECLQSRGDLLDIRAYYEDFVKEHI